MDRLGFLRLTGKEKIFAIDGQHRLAGIKKALEEGLDLSAEQAPVLLVGHKTTVAGLQRTRRLFTTLNKTAVPVRKRDIIALDEDDAMAIIVRRLVETHPSFRHPKIAVIASQNIPVSNRECLTTISNLYDILKLIFMFGTRQRSDRTLRFNRPTDEKLEYFEELSTSYFSALGKTFLPVGRLFKATNAADITPKFRGPHGGHLLFRPIGIEIFTRVAIELASVRDIELPRAVSLLKDLPTDLAKKPFYGVIWDPEREIMIPRGKSLARNILRYMAGFQVSVPQLMEEYKLSVGAFDTDDLELPEPIL
jgi:DNA sulfur modification protein DndB